MKCLKPLMICLGCALTLPALAAGEASGEYSSLRPKAQMEAPPEALSGARLVETMLTVEDIDRANRLVTLVGPSGNAFTVHAGSQVKNLDKVKKGDQVLVRYYQSMAVDVVVPGTESAAPTTTTRRASAEPGTTPAGVVGRQTTKTVKVLSVDPYKKAISFRDADGRWREVSMDRPDLEHYLTEIKDGDTVEVTYTEAVAVAVEPR
jgi:hypothetical protein